MQQFLIIQTAFIGDVVLATAMVEKLQQYFPGVAIDFLVRKGNESLLENNPNIRQVLVWDKRNHKWKNLFNLVKQVRATRYDKLINLQRYFSTGLLTVLSAARETIGFNKNPLSFFFNKKIRHVFNVKNPRHEVARNNDLIKDFTDEKFSLPRLYPAGKDFAAIQKYTSVPYITITPSSVWFTKKYPAEKWVDFINSINPALKIYTLGGADNVDEASQISEMAGNNQIEILAGKLSFLQSAALMKTALMNYCNDSAPLHFASAVNAPVTAVFCSTVPEFGYGPLSDISFTVETKDALECRPCGLHGYKKCPLGHFKCAWGIETEQLLNSFSVRGDIQR